MHPVGLGVRFVYVTVFHNEEEQHVFKGPNMKRKYKFETGMAALLLGAGVAFASSHREAPLITATPKLDATDFYMFNSYEAGRSNFVTFIADYLPLQDAYGGPNYFRLATN